ncbi:MAG: M48 family peptidase [Rickettsiaceae bacterium]|nr:MAG: M48 family peptidase [Rickettsiaceae bacterium]
MTDNVIFNYSSRAKKISLTIKQGKIVLTIPSNKGLEERALSFLELHFESLNHKLQKFNKVSLKIGSMINLLGNKYHVCLDKDEESISIKLYDNQLLIPSIMYEEEEKYIKKFLSFYLKQKITVMADSLCSKLNISYKKISVKQLKTKWGSCSSEGNLSFNWQLVLFNANILEYVVVHEVCHLKYLNHSQKFWQLVQNHCPHWMEARRWLKLEGIYFVITS